MDQLAEDLVPVVGIPFHHGKHLGKEQLAGDLLGFAFSL